MCAPLCALYFASLLALAAVTFARTAHADAPIRITGTASIEGSASSGQHGVELRARLFDDASHSIPGADLTLRVRDAHASSARSCAGKPLELLPNTDGNFTAKTDAAGAICVLFTDPIERSQIEITFADPAGLYAPTTTTIAADSAQAALELAFSPVPSTFALEQQQARVGLRTRVRPTLDHPSPIALTLSVSSEKNGQRQLLEKQIAAGEALELTFPTRELAAPGPYTLSAEFAGNSELRGAHVSARVEATARVQLELVEPVNGDVRDGVHVRARVSASVGAVPSGSVEARARGASVASAPVVGGVADVWVQLDDPGDRTLELRYAPDTTWWIAGSPLPLTLPLAQPSSWQRLPWMLALMAVGGWLIAGWRRPQRTLLERPSSVRAPLEGGVDIVATFDDRRGWAGQVVDRHDQLPIAGATILAKVPAFEGSGEIASATSDADGNFELGAWAEPKAAEVTLEVRAAWHTPLIAPLPRPGKLLISLVSRRRTLLARFVDWAGRSGHAAGREPTPGEIARSPRKPEAVTEWARAVDEAAFGPEPLSEDKERAVHQREPPHAPTTVPIGPVMPVAKDGPAR